MMDSGVSLCSDRNDGDGSVISAPESQPDVCPESLCA
jgi:hypothetical protein